MRRIISSIRDLVINAIPIIEHDRIHRYERPSGTKRAGSFFTSISSSASSLNLLPLLRPQPHPVYPATYRYDNNNVRVYSSEVQRGEDVVPGRRGKRRRRRWRRRRRRRRSSERGKSGLTRGRNVRNKKRERPDAPGRNDEA